MASTRWKFTVLFFFYLSAGQSSPLKRPISMISKWIVLVVPVQNNEYFFECHFILSSINLHKNKRRWIFSNVKQSKNVSTRKSVRSVVLHDVIDHLNCCVQMPKKKFTIQSQHWSIQLLPCCWMSIDKHRSVVLNDNQTHAEVWSCSKKFYQSGIDVNHELYWIRVQAFFFFVFLEHGSVAHDHDKTTDEEDRQNRVNHKKKLQIINRNLSSDEISSRNEV